MLRLTLSLCCLSALVACASTATTEGTGTITNTPPVNNGAPVNNGGTTGGSTGSTTGGVTGGTTGSTGAKVTGFTITPASSPSLCLGIVGTSVDGATTGLQNCNNTVGQRWYLSGGLVKTADGKCLGTQDETVTNYGEPMVVRGCDNDTGQLFALYKGMIYNTQNGNQWIAVAPKNGTVQANTALVVATYSEADTAQHWALNVTTAGGTGTVTGFPIVSQTDPTKCLAGSNDTVGVATCDNSSAQQWIYDATGALEWGGNTSDCLDVNTSFSNVKAGTLPILNTCNDGSTQVWLYSNAWMVVGSFALNPNTSAQPANGVTPGVLLGVGYEWMLGGAVP